MSKPYLLFKRPNGIYYCQIRLPDGSLTNNKSTGCSSKSEAEKVAMKWAVQGAMPARVNGREPEMKSTDFISILNCIRTFEFTDSNINEIISVLKQREYIKSAVISKTVEARPIDEYLLQFWDSERSPYIKEKRLKGQEIHAYYIANNLSYIYKYWIPRLEGKSVGEITRDDVNAIFDDAKVMKYAPKTINQIVSALTLPMKYAFYHKMTENNCYDGIIKCSNRYKKRIVLSLEETQALFDAEWENDSARLACVLACYTGMRQGEIAGLRLRDIGDDRIYIRHSWSKYEGLKSTKTEEEREMIIPPLLRDMLLTQAEMNPHGEGDNGFVFFGLLPSQPTDPKNWLKFMRRALKLSGYENPDEVTFHAFRHEWCTNTLSEVGDKRVCMIGSGHKTDSVFAIYSAHVEKEAALKKIAVAAEKMFLPMVESLEKVEYEIKDEDE